MEHKQHEKNDEEAQETPEAPRDHYDENFLRSRRHHPKRLAWPARAFPPVPGGGKGISCTWSEDRERSYYKAVTEYVQSEYLRTREHPVS